MHTLTRMSRILSILVALTMLAGAGGPSAYAAGLRVSDGTVVVEDGTAFVEVDVAWRLSWRNETNWDAAWLFVKAPAQWCGGTPLPLSPSGHRLIQNRDPDQPGPAFAVSDDRLGTFVYRNAQTEGRGPNDWRLRLQLALPDDMAPEDLPETVDVYGVEMTYVSEGPFSLGDPRPRADSPKHSFFADTPDTTAAPSFRVASDGAIPICDGPGSLCYRSAEQDWERGREGDFQGPIPASYPNGYGAFYLQKYDVTQGQYAAFLNDIGQCGAPDRSPLGHPDYAARGSIQFAEGSYGFVATRPDRPAHYLSWDDAAAFLDWAALRPMTELEFSKAARGPAEAGTSEFAWGSPTIARGDTLFDADGTVAEDEAGGDEYVRGNASYRPADTDPFVGGDAAGGSCASTSLRRGSTRCSTTTGRTRLPSRVSVKRVAPDITARRDSAAVCPSGPSPLPIPPDAGFEELTGMVYSAIPPRPTWRTGPAPEATASACGAEATDARPPSSRWPTARSVATPCTTGPLEYALPARHPVAHNASYGASFFTPTPRSHATVYLSSLPSRRPLRTNRRPTPPGRCSSRA